MNCNHCAVEIQKLKDEIEQQRLDLERIYQLPEQEWASVCAVLMQSLAKLSMLGYPQMAQEAMKALDRGQTYVTKLAAKVEREQPKSAGGTLRVN